MTDRGLQRTQYRRLVTATRNDPWARAHPIAETDKPEDQHGT